MSFLRACVTSAFLLRAAPLIPVVRMLMSIFPVVGSTAACFSASLYNLVKQEIDVIKTESHTIYFYQIIQLLSALFAYISPFLSFFLQFLNSLPSEKILAWSKLKAFADNKLNFGWKLGIRFSKGRTHCGKRRKCWLPAFSPFPTMFSKGFYFWGVKSRDCVVKS